MLEKIPFRVKFVFAHGKNCYLQNRYFCTFFFFLHQNKDRGEKKSNNPGIKITIEYGK